MAGRLIGRLRSPRLALGVLGFIAAYSSLAAWATGRLGSAGAPSWAAKAGLDQPFSAPPFLAAWGLLFLSTLACTWARTGSVLRLWRGEPPGGGARLAGGNRAELEAFLRDNGFRFGRAGIFRYRPALWGGWIFHVGLLLSMAGVFAQQLFHEGGSFEIAEGETVRLAEGNTVFDRQAGPLAAPRPPALELTLAGFDPFLRQPGYAPDRASSLLVTRRGRPPRQLRLDRASGARMGRTVFYQAIPAGISLTLEVPGMGLVSVHLQTSGERSAERIVTDPAGVTVHFAVETARPLDDRRGTGELRVVSWRAGEERELRRGERFPFGEGEASLVDVNRWGGFTYSVSPGMTAVFAGFAVVLLGSGLLLFPAGIASLEEITSGAVCHLYLTRGADAREGDWKGARRAEPAGILAARPAEEA